MSAADVDRCWPQFLVCVVPVIELVDSEKFDSTKRFSHPSRQPHHFKTIIAHIIIFRLSQKGKHDRGHQQGQEVYFFYGDVIITAGVALHFLNWNVSVRDFGIGWQPTAGVRCSRKCFFSSNPYSIS